MTKLHFGFLIAGALFLLVGITAAVFDPGHWVNTWKDAPSGQIAYNLCQSWAFTCWGIFFGGLMSKDKKS